MKLYGSLTSPYARKARILIAEKSIPCEFVVETPGEAGMRFDQLNPLGKVPVLELDNGKALFDSPVIVEYLDSLGGERMLPAAGDARWEVLRWQALTDGVLDAVVARLMETRRPAEQQSEEAIAKQEHKVARAVAYAEGAVTNQSFLVGDAFSVADLALGVALEYVDFRYPHDWRRQAPRLAFWQAGIASRPSFLNSAPPGMVTRPGRSH